MAASLSSSYGDPMNVWRALAGRGYLRSAWPWRAAAYLAGGAVFGAVVLVVVLGGLVVGGALAVVLLGLPLLVLTALAGIPVAAVERWRLRVTGMGPAGGGGHRVPDAPGLWAWLVTRVRETATWRELAYAVLLGLVLWPLDALVVLGATGIPLSMVAAPVFLALDGEAKAVKLWTVDTWPGALGVAALGLVLLATGAYALGVVAGARAELARAVLSSKDDTEDVLQLVRSRARLVDAFEAERRRIERDLHDGAQARLVNLAMGLGLAKEKLLEDPESAAEMVSEAHGEVKLALQELRDLARGIHPAVLTDRGLDAALSSVASRCTVPVKVTADLGARPVAAIEGIAYFTVSELLQNISKHSGARSASVDVWRADDRLLIQVWDDGRGGASLDGGTGMRGLAERLNAVDGLFVIDSPPGGPTMVTAELPWRDRSGTP